MAIDNVTGNESVEELQKLYALFENRMRILDEKKSFTKPEIYQKVRAEYEAKLVELQVLLEEKGVGMQEALDAAVAERDQLVARTHEIKDQLDEMELRAVIGEIDETTFAAKQQELQDESAAIDAQLQELSAKIENYQQLIGGRAPQAEPAMEIPMAAEPEPQPEPEVPPAPAPKPAVATKPAAPAPQPRPVAPQPTAPPTAVAPHPAAPRPVPPPAPAPKPAPVMKPAPAPVAEPKPAPPAAAPRPAPAPKPAPVPQAPPPAPAAPPASTEMDELEKQFASILSSTMADSAALEKPAMEEVFTQQMPDVTEQPQPVEPLPEALAGEPPAAEEVGEESHDGELKCPKCGAFNRADNWYCEKCGNELLNASDLLGGTK